MEDMAKDEASRRSQAASLLASIRAEAVGLTKTALDIAKDAQAPLDADAREALRTVVARFDNAVMRAQAGVLDTYWVRKEHISERIRAMGFEKESLQKEYQDAFKELSHDD
jgi:hypothetical protein